MFFEPVAIWTNWPQPTRIGSGYLMVGADSLPELDTMSCQWPSRVRPTTAPHTWYLTPLPGQEAGVLLAAWRMIQDVEMGIVEAEREWEGEEQERVRNQQIHNRIDQEEEQRP